MKTWETIYQVGIIAGKDDLLVTVIENETISTYVFASSEIDFAAADTQSAQCSLKVLRTNVLLWTNPFGTVLIDLEMGIVRSVYFLVEER